MNFVLFCVLLAQSLWRQAAGACLTGTCADLASGQCALLVNLSSFKLNNQKCGAGTACMAQALLNLMPMLPFAGAVNNMPYPCPEGTPTSTTHDPWEPQPCREKVAGQNWKNGGTIIFCTADSGCMKADNTYESGACQCVPRADAKGVCKPNISNTDVFGAYWSECESNGGYIINEFAHYYWEYAFLYIFATYTDLACITVFDEPNTLKILENAYKCSISDAACPCTAGKFYNLSTQTCDACVSPCQTCLKAEATYCMSCVEGMSLEGTAPTSCVCADGFYPNGANCAACNAACETCDGGSASSCLSCYTNAVLENKVCTCPGGFYGTPQACVACHAACLTCSDAGANKCMTCKTGAALTGTAPNTCACTSGSPDPSACSDCKTKTDTGDCATCFDGFYLATGKCNNCDVSCALCSAGGDTGCTTCHDHAEKNAQLKCACSDGYFPNPTSAACTTCNATCLTCSGATSSNCLSCKAHATLSSNQCACESSYYFDSGTSTCASCHANCLTCTAGGTAGCATCRTGAVLLATAPSSCACSSGSPDPTNCVICNSSCKSCSYTAPDTCTGCVDTLYLVSGVCRACPSTCNDCSGTDCKACYSSAVLTSASPKRCACPTGTFPNPDVTVCTTCHETCTSCSGAGDTACTGCSSPATLSGSKCACPSGTYPSPNAKNCVSCHATCSTCSGAGESACLTCKSGATLAGGAPNSCRCNDGTFPNPDATSCKACHAACKTCTGGTSDLCLSCQTSAQLSGAAPNKCACAAGLTGSPETGCMVCHSNCLACSDEKETSCTSCKIGALLTGPSPSKCACASGYLPYPDPAHCVACDDTCDPSSGKPPCLTDCMSCKDALCLKCANSLLLQPAKKTCLSACPDTYFSLNNTCTACQEPCVTCSSAADCLSCGPEHIVVKNRCVRDCPARFFSINDSMCMPCHETCQYCSGPLSTSCTVCRDGYRLKEGVCVTCDQCATCDDSGACLSCPVGSNVTSTGRCKSCTDCDKPLTVTLGSPKPNVFSVTFSRGVDHLFVAIDFDISTNPPALNLRWTVVNNPADRLLRMLEATATSLVYINIVEGTWDPKATFAVQFTNASNFSDEFGQTLPALNFTAVPPPLGPEAEVEDDSSGTSDSVIIGAVVGSVLGACLIVVLFVVFLRWRRRKKTKGMGGPAAAKYEEVGGASVNLSQ